MVKFTEDIRGYPGYPHMDEEIYIHGKGFTDNHPGIQGALKNIIGNSDNVRNMIIGSPTITQAEAQLSFTGYAFCNGIFTEFDGSTSITTAVDDYVFVKSDGTLVKSSNIYSTDGALLCKVTNISSGSEDHIPLYNKKFDDSGIYKWQISERLSLLSDTTYLPNGHTYDASGQTIDVSANNLNSNCDFTVGTDKFKVTATNGLIESVEGIAIATDQFQVGSDGTTDIKGTFSVLKSDDNPVIVIDDSTYKTTLYGVLALNNGTTDKFTVNQSTGNTVISGTLGVAGVSTFTGDVVFTNVDSDLIPKTTGTYDFGESSTRWNNIYSNTLDTNDLVVNTNVKTDLIPSGTIDLGSSGARWTNIYGGNVNTNSLAVITSVTSSLIPSGTIDLGSSGARWTNIYITDGDFSNSVNTNSLTATTGTFGGNVNVGSLTSGGDGSFTGDVIPSGSHNLGKSDNRWNAVYSTAGNFSGTVSIDTLSITNTCNSKNIYPVSHKVYSCGLVTNSWTHTYTNNVDTNVVQSLDDNPVRVNDTWFCNSDNDWLWLWGAGNSNVINGDTIILSSGVSTTTAVAINKNITVIGNKRSYVRISAFVSDSLFIGLEITGNGTGEDISVDGDHITFRDCYIYSIDFRVNGDNVSFQNCYFYSSRVFIGVDNQALKTRISNCYFYNNLTAYDGVIQLHSFGRTVIANNTFDIRNNSGSARFIQNDAVLYTYSLTITGNTGYINGSTSSYFIYNHGGAKWVNFTVTGNTAEPASDMTFNTDSEWGMVIGNAMYGGTISGVSNSFNHCIVLHES